MHAKTLPTTILFLVSMLPAYTGADVVSLFVPFVTDNSLALTASNAGTDGQGHTTWVIQAGEPSGTLVPPGTALLPKPYTLVEGSTDAHVIQTAFVSGPSGLSTRDGPEFYHEDCAISGTVAVCTNVFSSRSGQTTLPTLTTLATFVPVQVAAASGGASMNGAAENLAAAAGSILVAVGLGAAGALARAFL